MTTLPEGARRFLATGPLAHVITLDPDGSPHVSLAWAGFEDDQIVFSSFFDQRKLANLRRDPRVTLSFQANENVDKEFLHPYLVVEGRATVTTGGAMAVMDRLAPAYLESGYGGPFEHFVKLQPFQHLRLRQPKLLPDVQNLLGQTLGAETSCVCRHLFPPTCKGLNAP